MRMYLNQINEIDKAVENKRKALERLKSIVLKTTTGYDGSAVQSSGSQEKMADAVAEIVDIEREYESDIKALLKVWRGIVNSIERLRKEHFQEYDILMSLYVNGMSRVDYANYNGKSETWARKLHTKAIETYEEEMEKWRK